MRIIKKRFLIFLLLFLSVIAVSLCRHAPAKINEVHVVKINDDSINPITADYIISSIDAAHREGAECLIIELDTPGGLLTSTRLIVKKMMSSKIPVVVYIYPSGSRAGSAGVFITYASHVAAMAPSTNIGAAHPVKMGGGARSIWDAIRDLVDSLSKKARQDKDATRRGEEKQPEKPDQLDILGDKILHDTVAFIKALARERNRSAEWAEKSVTESVSITEEEALKNKVIEIIARDERDLMSKLNGRRVTVDGKTRILNTRDAILSYTEMNFRQRFLNVLANPNIAYILLLMGFYGLLFEVTHPGVGFPGITGAICIILAFFSMQILPTNYAGLALIILAIILFIAEVKVPGFGLLTLGGVVCMILGSLILFESPYKVMRVSIMLVIPSSLGTAGITAFLVGAVIRAHRRKAICGREGLIGETGYAKTNIGLERGGKVFVHGEIWDATAQEKIKKADRVRVVKVEGMRLVVEKV